MAGFKKILSDSDEKKRAAAFEAQMLAMLAKEKAETTDKSAEPVTPPLVVPIRDGIQISVSSNGQTTLYDSLEAVPAPVRQRIMNAWQPAQPPVIAQPVIHDVPPSPAPRPRSRRRAMVLNLILPGAGQFYLGQPVAGSIYACGFLACFVTSLVIFLRGYSGYIQMSTGGDILEGDNLERLTDSFHTGWLIGLQVVAIAIYIVSAIHLSRSRTRQ